MTTLSTKVLFSGSNTRISTYDQDKINLGPIMYQNTGALPTDKWVGPIPVGCARPVDNSAFTGMMPYVYQFTSDIQYVFLAEASTAAATKKILMYTYTISSATYSYIGYITLTYPQVGTSIIKGFRMDRLKYCTGTVAVSGTAVTGTGTLWTSNGKMAVGSRIGFGSVLASDITTWYQVTAIGSDTGITLGANAGTITAGSLYVIEEFRAVCVITNSVATSGGLTVTKGLNPSVFIPGGTTIAAATTIDGLRAVYYLPDAATGSNSTGAGCAVEDEEYVKGTVSSTGTAVITGVNTAWNAVAGRINAGARIGFGSIDPGTITNWYTISTIDSQTQITLTTSPTTITAGTAYCIVDNSVKYAYVLDVAGKVYKYNMRCALGTIATGRSTNYTAILMLVTGVQSLTGTMQIHNNGRVGTMLTGPGAGILCLYFATTTRIYRTVVTDIVAASTTWATDAMIEVPKGGTATYPITSSFSSIEIADLIDKIIVTTTPTVSVGRSYITQYKTDSTQFDYNIFSENHQQDQASADSSCPPIPNPNGLNFTCWSEKGICHIIRHPAVGTAPTALNNQMYAVPFGADWDFASLTSNRVITPRIATPNANNLNTVSVMAKKIIGGDNLGIQPMPYRVYCRTSGISDNSGSWTLINDIGDLTGISASSYAQFMFEFRTIGQVTIPACIYGVHLSYDDINALPNYRNDVTRSDATNKIFAFRFVTAFGATVPTLRIRIYNDVTGGILVDDTTVASTGTWTKATDGSTWGAYNTTDKANETTYIRYVPASMASGVIARAVITRA